MAAPDKTDALVNLINPKYRSIMKAMATIAGDSAVALINPLVRAGTWAADSDAPEKTKLRVDFTPLTDCASVVMTSTLGLDKRYGIKITPSKEASQAGVHDKFVSGDLDAAHVLYGLVYGVQLGIGGPKKGTAMLMTLNNNGQTIALSSRLREADVKDGASLRAIIARDRREYVFTQTFPTDTYAIWLYYWLAAYGIHPPQDAKAITAPPPRVVVNMRVGNMDGYYVGESWDAHAITDNIGFTAETTQAIWKDHPEKVLSTTAELMQKHPNIAHVLMAAMLETSKFIDASASNRHRTAEAITARSYINTDMGVTLDRMLDRYTNGLGKTWDDPDLMRFYRDGAINFPYLPDGMQFLTQHERWGPLRAHPDYLAVAKQVDRVDTFKQAVTATDTLLPKSDIRTAKLIDGVV